LAINDCFKILVRAVPSGALRPVLLPPQRQRNRGPFGGSGDPRHPLGMTT